jgi:P4 family phage/plasmid primase-like protien
MEFPEQLKEHRFVRITPTTDSKKLKMPLEIGWNTTNHYSMQEFNTKFPEDKKYGVLCGYKNLVIIDCDTKEFEDILSDKDLFKNTFGVRTANKQLMHFYFYTQEPLPSFSIDSKHNDSVIRQCDIKSVTSKETYSQTLGPNSVLETLPDRSYHVAQDNPISLVNGNELKEYLLSLVPNSEFSTNEFTGTKRKSNTKTVEDEESDPIIAYIKSRLTVYDLLQDWGISVARGANCECPFHDSESGRCFKPHDHGYSCYHCHTMGSMFDLAQRYYSQEDAQQYTFNEIKTKLATKVGVPEKVQKKAYMMAKKKSKADYSEYIVQQFLSNNYVKTIRNDQRNEIWIYNKGVYVPHGKSYITQYVRGLMKEYYTVTGANIILEKIMQDTMIDEQQFFNCVYENLIPVENGILNIMTLELSDFTPDNIFFNKLPILYDPEARCPAILDFFTSTLDDVENINLTQEFFGYCLWKTNRYKKAFLLSGNGDNGKSVYIDILEEMIGKENISNIGLQELDNDKFSASEIFGKMINSNADIGKGAITETTQFKKLVAGDEVQASRKFLTPVKFRNYAKFIFAANNIPDTDDESDGFFTRWCIIDFPYKFLKNNEYSRLSQKDLATGVYKVANPDIKDTLFTPGELSGLLNWSILGLHRLRENKKFSQSASNAKVKKYWMRKSSSMYSFVEDCLDITCKPDDFVLVEDMRQLYVQYCEENSLKVQSNKQANAVLNNYPVSYVTKRVIAGGGLSELKKVWRGVKYVVTK